MFSAVTKSNRRARDGTVPKTSQSTNHLNSTLPMFVNNAQNRAQSSAVRSVTDSPGPIPLASNVQNMATPMLFDETLSGTGRYLNAHSSTLPILSNRSHSDNTGVARAQRSIEFGTPNKADVQFCDVAHLPRMYTIPT
jgi:hypothetical protein